MKRSQACRKASGVFSLPNPYTTSPEARMRDASGVKSLSLDTRQKPLKLPV